MKKMTFVCSALIAALLMVPGAFAQGTQKATETVTKETKKAKAKVVSHTASAAEIADAKSKGMVWVNTNSKIYHKDGEFYGNTKEGKFMMEADAQKAGFRAAKDGAVKSKDSKKKKS